MAVTVNASDLAAVGAEPLGILLTLIVPPDLSDEVAAGLRAGIGAAADAYALPVLGGDTNHGPTLAVGGAAAGLVRDGAPLTRRGAGVGDRVFASGPLGQGAAFAFDCLAGQGRLGVAFRPVARLPEGRLLRGLASCCMDTSDGLIATLDELARQNGCGFTLTAPLERVLHPDAAAAARAAGLPPAVTLAGPHGEFELVFTVPPDRCDAFRAAAAAARWTPVELGLVTAESQVLRVGAGGPTIDSTRVRDLFEEVGGDVGAYVREVVVEIGA
jgi:thiamine-monophosphate kinase